MSYILDALRKADAERERGHVPGIHAQPMIGGSASPAAPRARAPWPWIVAGALALALVVALGWFLLRGAASVAIESRPAPDAAAPPVAPPPRTAAVAPVTPPAATKDEALPVIRQTRPAAPAPAATPTPATTPTAKAEAKPAAAASAQGEARIYALAELPDEIKRQLPAVSVGGSAYSKKAADRILIVNGQVLHEGDKVTPDLVLQQIKLRAAVLAFKGYRYEIAY